MNQNNPSGDYVLNLWRENKSWRCDVEVWECIKYVAYDLEARVFASIEEVVLE